MSGFRFCGVNLNGKSPVKSSDSFYFSQIVFLSPEHLKKTNVCIWQSKSQQHEKTPFIKSSGEVKMIQLLFYLQCPNRHSC